MKEYFLHSIFGSEKLEAEYVTTGIVDGYAYLIEYHEITKIFIGKTIMWKRKNKVEFIL